MLKESIAVLREGDTLPRRTHSSENDTDTLIWRQATLICPRRRPRLAFFMLEVVPT
ncbi:hypothetical protein IscW_ISCW003122 [Ixodes scapularis]|uniref:Uncharacterized protein n=1 Tax=Ixodes scapularis TaxID=6945 RepID=B7PBF1_IXOSC|nr:hypothetical protein IscW_ISCW003122 [Ixodes scapularis]|eukprot:XP_002408004.1 hypothetical protein IscW_ISCW003122 [Ixodes scapularis]